MNTSSFAPLSKIEQRRLQDAALQYGFSPEELSRRIIAEVTRKLIEIPEESLDEYKNADEIRAAHKKAIAAERHGKLLSSLPKSQHRDRV